jgi:hypothetical protein
MLRKAIQPHNNNVLSQFNNWNFLHFISSIPFASISLINTPVAVFSRLELNTL